LRKKLSRLKENGSVLNEERNIAKELAREYREQTSKMIPVQSL
jgi:hypothetical protein